MNACRVPSPTDFPGRDELEELLATILPIEWIDAARAGDVEAIVDFNDTIDRRAVVHAIGRAGWVAPHYEREHGGRGLSTEMAQRALSLLHSWGVPVTPSGSGLALAAPTIQQWSSEETKRHLLPPLLSGDERWCQLFSEPGAGSDLASLATTAVRDGDEWVVNGQKVWTTFGQSSERAMLLARTDPDQIKHKGITYFGLDMKSPGVEVRPLVNMAGQHEFFEVFLSDVRVPDIDCISPRGEGWSATQSTLGAERFALSGLAQKKRKSSDEILGGKPYLEIEQFARTLGQNLPASARHQLVRAAVNDRVLALSIDRARDSRAAGRAGGSEGSLTKIVKAASNQRLQEIAMDIRGLAATAWEISDSDAAEWVTQFLRTRANSIEGGTSEIQRNIIGERVLGLPREPDAYKGLAWRDVPR